MKKLIVLSLLCLIAACAPKTAQLPQSPQAGAGALAKMEEISAGVYGKPFKLQMSMRFGKEGDTRRVTGVMWGQGDDIRLDAMAGVGSTLAMIQDSAGTFLLYSPQEGKAYEHSGPVKPVLNIGGPLPFNLPQLARLLTGDYAGVFGQSAVFTGMNGDLFAYSLESGPQGELVLNANGAPAQWRKAPWQMALSYDTGALYPKSARLVNSSGDMAVLLVKQREFPPKSFDASQMTLELPPGTPLAPLKSQASPQKQ